MADDPAAYSERDHSRDRLWTRLSEALVWPRLVVVDQEGLDHSLQVAGAKDELVIEHLAPAGADEPLTDRVRLRGPEGQLHDFDAFRTEDLIEADGELGVAVPGAGSGP